MLKGRCAAVRGGNQIYPFANFLREIYILFSNVLGPILKVKFHAKGTLPKGLKCFSNTHMQ